MAPTTRSGAKPKSESVISKKSPKAIKKKTQPKKPAVKKPAKHEEDKANQENGHNREETEKETASNAETSETVTVKKSSKATTKKPKKPAEKKKKIDSENDEIDDDPKETEEEPINNETIYEFTVKDIDGNDVSLEKYRGKVCIIVNVASRCGHTKSNYEQFVQLYDKYADSNDLSILAFPCNQFGSQEPATCEKIKAFAENKGVKFDMFDKINVNGKNASPLWQFLKEKLPEVTSGKQTGKNIKWNFTKFIIDKEGVPVERYASNTKPLTLVDSLEKLL